MPMRLTDDEAREALVAFIREADLDTLAGVLEHTLAVKAGSCFPDDATGDIVIEIDTVAYPSGDEENFRRDLFLPPK